MLEHALTYAAQGLPVFPLVPRTKRPATAHGKDDATTDPATIRAWWTATPDANIAARPPEGVVVLDIDPRHGGTLDALGDLPTTYRARTGGGGWHVWYWLPDGIEDRVRGKLDGAEGIDVKTSSGYLVMPPSVHPDGGRYVLEDDTEPADLPVHLLERVVHRPKPRKPVPVAPRGTGVGYWDAALRGELEALSAAQNGTRNETLNRAAFNLGQLVGAAGVTPSEVTDQLVDAGRATGLDEHELHATIRSGLLAGMDNPRGIPSGSSGLTGPSGSTSTPADPSSSGLTGSTSSSGSSEGVTVDRTEPVLDEVRDWLARFVRTTSPGDLDILALWAVHTHFMGQLYTTPRLLLDSPMPEAGKTTVVEHFARLCFSPVQAAALSSAALLARLVRSEPRTLLIDEADRNLDPKRDNAADLLSVINTGYKRGGTRPVLVAPVKGGDWVAEEMSTYSPVLMAGISPNLPDDTRSRCIRVVLMRDHDDTVEESDWEAIEDDAEHLAARIAAWAEVVADEVATTRPPLPAGIKGRARERWSPLKRIATVAGGRWPATVDELATAEAEELRTEREEGHVQKRPALALIDHIAEVWKPWEKFVGSEDLVRRLIIAHPEVWGADSSYGRALTVQRMGRMLSNAYKVHTTRQATDDRTRGYTARSLDAATSGLGLAPLGEPDEPSEAVEPDGGGCDV